MARGIGPTLGTATTDRISGPTLPKLPQASISAWILVNGLGGTSSGAIVANTNNASFNWGIGVVTNTSTLRVRARGWSTQIGTWTAPLGAGGTWQHIVVTYDHSSTGNNPVVFVNGISQTVTRTQAPTGTFTNSPQPVAIGCEVSNAFNFDGLIAHVAWWNGILLSAPDALALASGVSPLMVRPDSLTFYVPLDGVSNPEPDMVGSPWSLLGTRSTVSEPPDTTGNLISLEPRFNFRAAASATQMQATQVSIEEWARAIPPQMQLTQIAIEEWVSTNVTNPQMIVTQIGVEMWASVAAAIAAQQARAMILP